MKILSFQPVLDRRNWTRNHGPKEPTHFIGVDGEGSNYMEVEGEADCFHKYVLLGVGDKQIENPNGLNHEEIFSFLYSCFEENPNAAFVGFYLSYDFNQWIKTLPIKKAILLLTSEGQKLRRRKNSPRPFPVVVGEWELDIIPMKRFALRKITSGGDSLLCKDHEHSDWMYICDTGPFWQTSFLNTINPKNWTDPVVTQEEYNLIYQGKAARAEAVLDDNMRMYNRLENNVLARIMGVLEKGFREAGVNLHRNQWFGPGQAAQFWLKTQRAPRREKLEKLVPEFFMNAAQRSYIAGWFEITCHGIIPGVSHEYDLNSAYPYILASLPCLEHGEYSSGTGNPPEDGYTLIHGIIRGSDKYLGAMLHRAKGGGIVRPHVTRGWFWLHEIEASKAAGLVDSIEIEEWVHYKPCDCPPPLKGLRDLYELRLKMGKNTALGKGAKLTYNSAYGKFAQTAGLEHGGAPFNNWIYASLTTAGTRTLILNAIATHPERSKAVVMIATDGIYFTSEHPSLHISETELGAWDHKTKENLTLFKPGVYWDDKARSAIEKGESPAFKARGINAKDFGKQIMDIDKMFARWETGKIPGEGIKLSEHENYVMSIMEAWPQIEFQIEFSMVSGLQAIRMNNWNFAGYIGSRAAIQSSMPEKRIGLYRDNGLYRSYPLDMKDIDSVEYEKKYGIEDVFGWEYSDIFGLHPDADSASDILNDIKKVLTGEET